MIAAKTTKNSTERRVKATMNMKRLKELRDHLAQLPPAACDMGTWLRLEIRDGKYVSFQYMKENHFECGSVGCLAGWAVALQHKDDPYIRAEFSRDIKQDAIKWLEIDPYEAHCLFTHFPNNEPEVGWKAWMVARLDQILKRGGVIGCVRYSCNMKFEPLFDEPAPIIVRED
jgi:hypothetical protein